MKLYKQSNVIIWIFSDIISREMNIYNPNYGRSFIIAEQETKPKNVLGVHEYIAR